MWRKEEEMEEEVNEKTAYRNWAGNNRDGDGDRSAVGIGIEMGWHRHRRLF